ncbi:transglycosylase SLT domain-containing protein [Candidatus Gottesmanbacteria bacterium]|nr:transglycosylase SLT domain-containing protein [Candidatus Gottesmanbacteria bacterium]
MKVLTDHWVAVVGGTVVPPIIYFLATGISHVIASPVSPSPTQTPTPTISLTPTPTPIPTPTSTPTPRPTLAPTQTPTPTLPPVTSEQLDSWFTKYSNEYSIDRQKFWLIAVCESNLNPHARNGDYGGLYQFASRTWRSTRSAMNMDTNSDLRFNPEEAIKTAAFKISTVGLSAWPNCGK